MSQCVRCKIYSKGLSIIIIFANLICIIIFANMIISIVRWRGVEKVMSIIISLKFLEDKNDNATSRDQMVILEIVFK